MNAHTATPDRPNPVIELIRRHRTHPTSPKGHPPTRTGQRSDHLRDLRRTAHRQHVIHLPDCRELEKDW